MELQPGTAEAIKLLAIAASDYGDDTRFVTYIAQAGADNRLDVKLRAPHVFTEGTVVLLGQPPQQLTFKNPNIASRIDIQVFVARSAH